MRRLVPVYVSVAGAPVRSPADAAYFVAWVDRLIVAAQGNTNWNTEAEKKGVLALLVEAKRKYEALAR
jgi:predicted RNase H-like HicB family nuclease